MNEKIFKASEWQKLEDPARREWLPPDEVIRRLDLKSGLHVADIGAGTGYFALPLAEAIGPQGRLYAIDLQPLLLERLAAKLAAPTAPNNLELIEATATATTLPADSVDLALLANLWHELDQVEAVLTEVRRILRSSGRLAILDWRPDVERPPGPPLAHRIASGQVRATLEDHNWEVDSEGLIGRFSYLLIATPVAK